MIYGVIMIAVTVALGVALSLLVGPRIANIDWSFLDAGDPVWAIGEAIAGIVLLVWGIRRLRRPASEDTSRKSHGGGLYALSGLGVLYGASSILDPTFVALVVVAGREGNFLHVSLAHLLWILISQAPLVVVLVAIMMGRQQTIIGRLQAWWQKIRPVMSRVGTGLALLAAVVLLADAGWWFFTGNFLIEF